MIVLFIVVQSLSNWIYFVTWEEGLNTNWNATKSNTTQAAWPKEENKLVAIFVDQNIYNSIAEKIERYSVQYIQKYFPRTKALVFPVDTSTITPKDIQKILSNLYHGWEKDVPSTLIGTILIGNIPLPTIQTSNNGEIKIQKSILPYTDLEKPTYEYNNERERFLPISTNVDNEQELFHWLIIFNSPAEYIEYFNKLEKYIKNPESFATKKMRYDDFIQLQKNYTEENSASYAKKQIFDEDLLYHRYTPALFNIITEKSNTDAIDLLSEDVDLPDVNNTSTTNALFSAEEQAYNESLKERQGDLTKQAEENKEQIKNTLKWELIPTVVMGQSILEQLKKYSEIFAPEYWDIIFNQMWWGAGRWTDVDIGNNVTKITAFDEATSDLFFSINDVFENALDAKISGDALSLDIPLPVFNESYPCKTSYGLCNSCDPNIYACEKADGLSTSAIAALLWGPVTAVAIAGWGWVCKTSVLKDKDEAPNTFEAFYFGKNALDITGADQTTWYRWTYGNITWAAQALALPWSKDALSIWSSLGFTDQQVLASRWYNLMKAQWDGDILNALADQKNKSACTKKLKKVAKKNEDWGVISFYVDNYWGWHSPLNLTWSWPTYLASDLSQRAYNPSTNRLLWGALFDIAWSTLAPITGKNYTWTNVLATQEFGNFRITTTWNKKLFDRIPVIWSLSRDLVSKVSDITWLFEKKLKNNEKEVDWCESDEEETKFPITPIKNAEFFSSVNKSNRDIQVIKELSGSNIKYDNTPTCKNRVVYKTISSIVKHTSPTPEEVKWMNITTQARWVDTKRYISFKSIGWNIINLNYPNLYDVPVYLKSWSTWTLQSTTGIKENIKTYLQDVVKEYNKILLAENDKIATYLSSNSKGFALLEKQNPLASPTNRKYNPIPEDFYVKQLNDEVLNQLADMLYIKSSPRWSKISQNTVAKTIDQSISTMHIENKIQNIMERNLVFGEKGIGVNTAGYEMAYIRSAGSDAISATTSVPSFIQDAITKIDQRKAKNTTDGKGRRSDIQQQLLDTACSANTDGTVPLLQWPKALTCRRKNLQTFIKDWKIVEVSYKNAQGPVYALEQFKNTLKESYQDYIAYVTGVINPQLWIEPANEKEAEAFNEQAKLNTFSVGTMAIETPTKKVLRGSLVPISISAKNKNGDTLSNLYQPVRVNIDNGFFPESSSDTQISTEVDITDPLQPVFIDTSSIPWGKTIKVSANGDGIDATTEIIVVDWALRVLVNKSQVTETTLKLPNTSYMNTSLSAPIILENKLPSLDLSLTDSDGSPLHSVAQITSEKWLIQPCKIVTGDGGKQCMQESLWDINGEITVRLLPSMKAGKDAIHINISWLPERVISFTILPADPYRVTVAENTWKQLAESEYVAALELFDVRNNNIIDPTNVTYNLIWEATDMTDKTGGVLSINNGKWLLPIKFGKQGGANYIYAEIWGENTIPWYMRWDTAIKLWPEEKLNVVYLTLLGDDRGNPDTTKIPKMITSSPKLLAVTTSLENPTSTDPVDLEPLRSYGWWKTVGESWKMQFDPSIITYGDPMLQHQDANKSIRNDTTSVRIWWNQDKSILKVLEFDIDNDGRKDMIILYDDDSVEFMKQYWWSPAYRKLGNLMNIVDGVVDIRVGDWNADGFPDIFVKTKRETLRVYINDKWVFPTDWVPICLNVPSGTTSTKWIWDVDIADMNNDGNVDIVTNDIRGQITIFYGWKTSQWWYYVSNTWWSCDDKWFDRQEKKHLVVATFWMWLQEGVSIYDDSLLHWWGLTFPPDDGVINLWPELEKKLLPNEDNPANFNIDALMKIGVKKIARYSGSPYDTLPYGEERTPLDSIAYIPSRQIISDDPVYSYKTYARWKDWNIIVTVTIGAKLPSKVTYIEQLLWPWKIERGQDYNIIWFNSGSLVWLQTAKDWVTRNMGNSPFVNRNPWNPWNGYQFMIDNLYLQGWAKISFSYPIIYTPSQIARIKVKDVNSDWRLDISTTSLDQCAKAQVTYQSNAGASYQTIINKEPEIDNGSGAVEKANKNLQNAYSWIIESIDWLNEVIENWDKSKTLMQNIKGTKLLENWFSFNGSFEISESIFWEETSKKIDEAEKIATTIFQGACKWFVSGDWTKWLAVPFNVALLAPWDINVFGCKVDYDWWIPIFAAPTNWLIPFWPPNPVQAGGRFGQNASISQVRIYVAPTLTLSVWVAICAGSYAIWKNIPRPLSALWGNCIVFAKRPGSSATAGTTPGESETSTTDTKTIGKTCRNPYPDPDKPISPLIYGTSEAEKTSSKLTADDYNPFKSWPRAATQWDIKAWSTLPWWTYLGILDLDSWPEVENNIYNETNKDQLKWGKPIQLKIQTWKVNGLLKCIVQKWLDNQIRYIANNLTNMSINITIPDPKNIFDSFKNLDFGGLEDVTKWFEKNSAGISPAWSALKDLVTISSWDMLRTSQSDVTNLSSITSNPFNALSSWFDDVPMIRVNTKNVTIQIPFIYDEQLSKFEAEVKAYGKKLESSYEEREKGIQDLAWTCWKKSNEMERDGCNSQLEKAIKYKDDFWKMQTDIKQLLQTIEAYKRFPASLKEWVNVSERYMSELTNTLQGVSTDMTSWLNTNATRFSSYVDSIILMVGAVKSWQPIIDLSTNRKSKCGKCTVDTYDYYSCMLSLLCPKLPILAIPPFKIPNIYIDLSNINLWMDILLPNIRFVPKRIELPKLPEPPSIINLWGNVWIDIDVNIPEIPTLPAPPVLPELPSVIPSIDLNLPTLPPAPKIPNLNPSISATLKVISKIWNILCMVKNFKLTAEGDVKTKIEQLTQRTWNVEPFDSLSITRVTPPLRWFDVKISTYLNFEFSFGWVYSIVDELAKKINNETKKFTDWVWKGTTALTSGANGLNNFVDDLNITPTLEVKWTIWKTEDTNSNQLTSIIKNKKLLDYASTNWSKDVELVEPNYFRMKLQSEISAFKQSEFGSEYKQAIDGIQWILDADTKVTPDYASIQKANDSLQKLIAEKKNQMSTIKEQLNNYDEFLDKTNTTSLISDSSVAGTISARLYKTDEKTKYIMDTAEHPTKTYIDLEANLASGFLLALQNHAPQEMNMSESTHGRLITFFDNTVKDISTVKKIIEPAIEKDKADKILAASNRLNALAINKQSEIIEKKDMPIVEKDWKTVLPAITDELDINEQNLRDDEQNIKQWWYEESWRGGFIRGWSWKIWRDEHNVYTNHTTRLWQKNDGTRYTRFYIFKPIQYYRNLLEVADKNGFVSIYNSAFDLANKSPVITSFEAVWQSNNTAGVQWANTKQQAYIISQENRIIDNHELDTEKRYIIAYADWLDLNKTYIDIDWLPKKKLSDIKPNDNVKLVRINPESETIALTLDLPEKIWSYMEIAHCMIIPREDMDWGTLQRSSAWSHQETLWSQRRWDSSWPNVTVTVINKKTNEVISTGTTAMIPRKGNYDIAIRWKDEDTVVQNSWNEENNETITTKDGWENIIKDIPIKEKGDNTPLVYEISAFDQASNTTRENITITFVDPTISIESAPKIAKWFNVNSDLSMIYPDAYVRFYAIRDGMEFLLTWRNGQQITTDFPTPALDTEVIWGLFGDADTITLVDEKNEDLVKVDKKTWKVSPCSWKEKSYEVRISIANNIPVLLVIDKKTWKTLFTIYIKSKELVNAKSLDTDYPLIDLAEDFPWTFAGWKCLQDKDNPKLDTCALYLSKDWNIFIPDANQVRFGWTYSFNWSIEYTLTLDGKNVLKVVFISEELK